MNKASRGDGIPTELFQFLKDDAVKVLLSICQQIWTTQQWLEDWKMSVFIPIPKKSNAKEFSSEVAQSCPSLCDPMDCSPPGSSVHGDSPGKNTGVYCHALLQGIFPTQE